MINRMERIQQCDAFTQFFFFLNINADVGAVLYSGFKCDFDTNSYFTHIQTQPLIHRIDIASRETTLEIKSRKMPKCKKD